MYLPSTLIESWLPFEAIGAECQRERGASSALPPLYFLHVWWARRPLTVSRAAILASLLPSWDELVSDRHFGSAGHLNAALRRKFPTEQAYHAWFQRLLGILGDSVAARKLLTRARQQGKSIPNPYEYDRAFKYNPPEEELETMLDLLEQTWGTRAVSVMDPMAGGGSIPFEALRYGFTTIANELNPVASVILKATLDYPTRFGTDLVKDIRKWGKRWYELVKPKLEPYFTPLPSNAAGAAYLWARTVACPVTGKPVPLSPNWWLSKGSDPVAVRLLTDPAWDEPRFEIVRGEAIDFDPNEGTVSRGVGKSPWTGDAIEGDYIKSEAQAGRMGQMLYAVVIKQKGGYKFRTSTTEDLATVRRAVETLAENLSRWEAAELVPRELFPEESNDPRPLIYGMSTWGDFFSPRQLFSLETFLETLCEMNAEMQQELDAERAKAVETYLGVMMDKAALYNARLCRFDSGRGIRSIFDRHDFAFVWSHAEFDASANLLPWCVDQIVSSYKEMAELASSTQLPLWRGAAGAGDDRHFPSAGHLSCSPVDRLQIWQGSATDLSRAADQSVHHICIDPPYYDNVMYAELSDFFYVWLKRSVGHLYPNFFRDHLTNKDDEAVANPARFASLGRKKKELAKQDYERKMAAAFREMYRVLRDDGVLTIMFTHKQVEAWDTLAAALIGAGFAIKASWPVHTESEHSLHQARKNAAASTILLVCRKRQSQVTGISEVPGTSEPVWWDDLKGQVRQTAREKALEFIQNGISGVDLYISTFGPTLAVISERWPVLTSEVDEKTGEPKPLRPETALDLAREEVITLRKRGLLLGRDIEFDAVTDWYLMAWHDFRAEQFPADEARKLALAMGLDVEQDLIRGKRVIRKKGRYVVLQKPQQRRRKGLADPEATVFDTLLDALHAAMLLYQEDGAAACEMFLQRTGLRTDSTFRAGIQAMLNAIPRTQIKGKFVRREAQILDNLRLNFFEDLTVPAEEEPATRLEQMKLV